MRRHGKHKKYHYGDGHLTPLAPWRQRHWYQAPLSALAIALRRLRGKAHQRRQPVQAAGEPPPD